MFSVVFSCCCFFYRVKKGPTEDCFLTTVLIHILYFGYSSKQEYLVWENRLKPQYIPITTTSHSICIAASLSDLH